MKLFIAKILQAIF